MIVACCVRVAGEEFVDVVVTSRNALRIGEKRLGERRAHEGMISYTIGGTPQFRAPA